MTERNILGATLGCLAKPNMFAPDIEKTGGQNSGCRDIAQFMLPTGKTVLYSFLYEFKRFV
jgi:hypothetical protein